MQHERMQQKNQKDRMIRSPASVLHFIREVKLNSKINQGRQIILCVKRATEHTLSCGFLHDKGFHWILILLPQRWYKVWAMFSPPAALRRWAGPLGYRCRWSHPCRSSSCSGCSPGGESLTAGRKSWQEKHFCCHFHMKISTNDKHSELPLSIWWELTWRVYKSNSFELVWSVYRVVLL